MRGGLPGSRILRVELFGEKRAPLLLRASVAGVAIEAGWSREALRRVPGILAATKGELLEDGHGTWGGHLFWQFDSRAREVHVEHPRFGFDLACFESRAHRGGYLLGVLAEGEGEDGRAGPREAGAEGAVFQSRFYDVFEARDEVRAVGLV